MIKKGKEPYKVGVAVCDQAAWPHPSASTVSSANTQVRRGAMLRASLLFFAAWALGSEAHMVYQQQIPNGARVIRNGVPWFAVGHKKACDAPNSLRLIRPDLSWEIRSWPRPASMQPCPRHPRRVTPALHAPKTSQWAQQSRTPIKSIRSQASMPSHALEAMRRMCRDLRSAKSFASVPFRSLPIAPIMQGIVCCTWRAKCPLSLLRRNESQPC